MPLSTSLPLRDSMWPCHPRQDAKQRNQQRAFHYLGNGTDARFAGDWAWDDLYIV